MVTEYQERKQRAQERRHHHATKDRLQPALFDRLTDNAAHKKKESEDAVLVTYEVLRAAVLRDLAWLLNTVSLESIIDLEGLEEVQTSTINYGVSPLAGVRMSEIDPVHLQGAIRSCIVAYEPRLLEEHLVVECVDAGANLEHHNILTIVIKGMLWCNPYPREFFLRTSLDLESGHMEVKHLEG